MRHSAWSCACRRPPISSSCHRVITSTTRPPGLRRVSSSDRNQPQSFSRSCALTISALDLIGSSIKARSARRPVIGPRTPATKYSPRQVVCQRPAARLSCDQFISEARPMIGNQIANLSAEVLTQTCRMRDGDDRTCGMLSEPPSWEQDRCVSRLC